MNYYLTRIALCIASIGISASAYALGTDKAKGTQVVQPASPVDVNTCLACHTRYKNFIPAALIKT